MRTMYAIMSASTGPCQPTMSLEYSGRGDPRTTLSLLWGLSAVGRRGRKPALTPEHLGAAAVALADASGVEGVTMRLLAQRLGVSTMAIYRYVPGKAELLDLMVECAHGELPPQPPRGTLGQRVRRVAEDAWQLYLRHPWLLEVSTYRAALGPNSLRKYERELHAVAGAGLSDLEMDLVAASVSDYVRGTARTAVEARAAQRQTGQSDAQWWAAYGQVLQELIDPAAFPLAVRVGAAAGAEYGATTDPERAFAFGLQRLIDGIEALVASRAADAPDKKKAVRQGSRTASRAYGGAGGN